MTNQGVQIKVSASQEMYFIHSDYLNTPQVLTDSNQQVAWRVEQQSPFGEVVIDQDPDSDSNDVVFNLRFPGQYYDEETGTNYNYYRTYDSGLGRYIQSDPIGLSGGINTYGYVNQNPLVYTDPTGEASLSISAGIGIGIGAGALYCALNPKGCERLSKAIENAIMACMDDDGEEDAPANDEDYDESTCDDLLLLLKAYALEIIQRRSKGADVTLLMIQYRKMLTALCETCPNQCAEAHGWGL